MLFFFPLLGQALPCSLVGYLDVVGDELLRHARDGLGHLLELVLGEAGHDLGAVYPLHPACEAGAEGSEGEAHDPDQLQPVLVGVLHELFQGLDGVLASL